MIRHCEKNVEFYRRVFQEQGIRSEEIRSLEDIRKLPIVKKEDVFDYQDQFAADDLERYNAHLVRTTGTTGTPLRIWWDRDVEVIELCCQWRHYSWMGYRLGDAFADIRNVIIGMSENYRWNWKCRGLEININKVNEDNLHKIVESMAKHKVKFWRGHAEAIFKLCSLLDKIDQTESKPDYIILLGEGLAPEKREFIDNWLGKRACDNYGLMEHTALICQCPEGGNHVCSEYGIVEILCDDGSPALPGEEGRIVATGLHNRAFPLLRYDTGDFAVASDKVCVCGRSLPLVERIIGRTGDYVLNAHGEWKYGLSLSVVDVENEIRKSQIVQDAPGELKFYFVPTRYYTENIKAKILERIAFVMGPGMKVTFHPVEELPYKQGVKTKYVICKLKRESRF